MRLFPDRKIGLRTALVAIVVGGIVLSAAALHLAWWRTATSVSRELVDVLETQISASVRRDWWGVVGELERQSQGMRDLLDQAADQDQARADSRSPPAGPRARSPGCCWCRPRAR